APAAPAAEMKIISAETDDFWPIMHEQGGDLLLTLARAAATLSAFLCGTGRGCEGVGAVNSAGPRANPCPGFICCLRSGMGTGCWQTPEQRPSGVACALPALPASERGDFPRPGTQPGAVWPTAASTGSVSGRAAVRPLGARACRCWPNCS